jgi:acyl carrier protein
MEDSVYLKLYDWIKELIGWPSTIVSAHTFDYLGFDSIDIVELLVWAEEEFDIVISDGDMQDIKTVGEFASHIESLIGE